MSRRRATSTSPATPPSVVGYSAKTGSNPSWASGAISGVAAGDMLIIFGGSSASPLGDMSDLTGDGWTQIYDDASPGSESGYAVLYWKKAASSDVSASPTVTSGGGHYVMIALTDVDADTAPTVSSTGIDTNDPASVSADSDGIVLALAFTKSDATGPTSGPSGYSTIVDNIVNGTGNGGIGAYYKNSPSTTEDPGTIGGVSSGDFVRISTIAVDPA